MNDNLFIYLLPLKIYAQICHFTSNILLTSKLLKVKYIFSSKQHQSSDYNELINFDLI